MGAGHIALARLIIGAALTLGFSTQAWASCEDRVQHPLASAHVALDHLSDPETLDEVFVAKRPGIVSRVAGSFRAWLAYVSQRNPKLVVWERTTKNVAL